MSVPVCKILTSIFLSILGSKYDLDFKSPKKSGQNFKSGEEMIEIYKELCKGIGTSSRVLFVTFIKGATCGCIFSTDSTFFSES